MALSKDDKTESLKKYGALNPHPQKVVEETFSNAALEFLVPMILCKSNTRCYGPSKRKAAR